MIAIQPDKKEEWCLLLNLMAFQPWWLGSLERSEIILNICDRWIESRYGTIFFSNLKARV